MQTLSLLYNVWPAWDQLDGRTKTQTETQVTVATVTQLEKVGHLSVSDSASEALHRCFDMLIVYMKLYRQDSISPA